MVSTAIVILKPRNGDDPDGVFATAPKATQAARDICNMPSPSLIGFPPTLQNLPILKHVNTPGGLS